ncbi:GNAT family N-acetyltransferase [Neobacillus sp. PS2-9]|uniref:GNAT family N-acetyltransferase n=1 Tax=Neobacillus sp. PS2-9 TaxID=3070676 RepID=UPI0027DED63D|nr:GNAT family N-acetyltransferase [Neobacillus sp. PS2-9]WML58817.1 GNAT family N-acetyltransferase [Neobacillus sp. PS2-9]
MDCLHIRKMEETDKEFIIGLSTRFTEFDFMEWRDPQVMKDAQLKMAQEAVHSNDPDSDIFVVEDDRKNLLGFLHMTKNVDYFSGEEQGYISSIAVAKEGEGKGIARKLMEKAEEWTRSKGYKQLTLNVFAQNERAINLYKKFNFENEIVKMVKEL